MTFTLYSELETMIWSLTNAERARIDRWLRADPDPLVAEMLAGAQGKLDETIDWLKAAAAELPAVHVTD